MGRFALSLTNDHSFITRPSTRFNAISQVPFFKCSVTAIGCTVKIRSVKKRAFETLEPRYALDSAWQNAFLPNDVDRSGNVTPLDALQVIDDLNRNGSRSLPSTKPPEEPSCDVNGDQFLDPSDVLVVVDAINRVRTPMTVQAAIDPSFDLNANGAVLVNNFAMRGQTNPDFFVDVVFPNTDQTLRVRSDVLGVFSIPVNLPFGNSDLQITAMDDLGRKAPMVSKVRVGNVVQEWNAAALNAIRDWRGTTNDPKPGTTFTSEPPKVARNLAMIQGAMFDAINAIEPRYEPFVYTAQAPSGLSSQVAAAAAAYQVASKLYTAKEAPVWEKTLSECLQQYSQVDNLQASIEFGFSVGDSVLASRANDGSDAVVDYRPEIGRAHV